MTTQETIEIPPPPRPINPRAARRSWNERPARIWIILLALVGAATAFFGFVRISEALRERAIIFRGEQVAATVTAIEGSLIANRKEANVNGLRVELKYRTAGGADVDGAQGRLQPSEPPQVAVGDKITVRVDPLKPENWTTRTKPVSWAAELLFVWPLLPLLALIVLMIFVSRRRMLSVWRDGVEAEGIVIDARQSSIAPASRIVRYVLADGSDQTVFSVLCPSQLAPAGGETIHIVHASANPGRAIAAELYV